MRGDFFEDVDKAVLKEIEEQAQASEEMSRLFPADWLTRQSVATLAYLLEAITEELARRREAKGGGY